MCTGRGGGRPGPLCRGVKIACQSIQLSPDRDQRSDPTGQEFGHIATWDRSISGANGPGWYEGIGIHSVQSLIDALLPGR